MPFISQEFTHTIESYNTTTLYYHYKNPKDNYVQAIDQASLEASQHFFNDLKSMLEQTGLDITYSENLEYTNETNVVTPSFNFYGLSFSPIVAKAYASKECTLLPFIVRHYTSLGLGCYRVYTVINSNAIKGTLGHKARISRDVSEQIYEINYTIEIYYNTDFLIINYRPYGDKTIKFTMCCLIKGVDINDKVVMYESGGCNTFMGTQSASFSLNDHSWGLHHRLTWADSPYLNPYNSETMYPSESNDYATRHDVDINANDLIFFDLCNNRYATHDSGIKRTADSPDDVVLYRVYCCRGNVIFSDNILTGPIRLSLDTIYVVNGEEYYCPGDYTSIMESISDSSSYQDTRTMRFLLKL